MSTGHGRWAGGRKFAGGEFLTICTRRSLELGAGTLRAQRPPLLFLHDVFSRRTLAPVPHRYTTTGRPERLRDRLPDRLVDGALWIALAVLVLLALAWLATAVL